MLTLACFLLAGLLLPLFPLSIGVNLLLQSTRPGRLGQPQTQAALILLMPLAGVGLIALGLALAEDQASTLMTAFALWGGATSLLYAFRMLSARDGRIWLAQLYSSALSLIWVGVAHQVPPLLPALGLALPLLPLLFLLDSLARRFGIARVGLYPGLGQRMPRFSTLFIIAVLVAIAVPFSPSFFAIADLAFGGVGRHDLVTLLPLGISWLLWTWAGTNLLTGIVFGIPRDDLQYPDLKPASAVAQGAGMLGLALFGLFLVERAL
ncbi:MAG: hypothetical protein VBE63_06310 [Lamprobacter sp.]|uniref:hypothetical protein n=1 Tax=Lamprobacter sp. TaxID=3100796 RepID=UPI002B262FB2|nr:hypothetical protein [Lamprobacter sp.]MEA3639540.1 hypothetical protein [Lamprobacter sp.]